jgi:hypothetical protein
MQVSKPDARRAEAMRTHSGARAMRGARITTARKFEKITGESCEVAR